MAYRHLADSQALLELLHDANSLRQLVPERRGDSVSRPQVDAGGSLFVVTLLVVLLPIAAPSISMIPTRTVIAIARAVSITLSPFVVVIASIVSIGTVIVPLVPAAPPFVADPANLLDVQRRRRRGRNRHSASAGRSKCGECCGRKQNGNRLAHRSPP